MLHAPHIPNSNKSSATFNVTAESGTELSKEIVAQRAVRNDYSLARILVMGRVSRICFCGGVSNL